VNAESRFEDYIRRVAVGPRASRDLTREEARDALDQILTKSVSELRAGVLLIALRMKRETLDENRGMLDALREHACGVVAPVDAVLDLADPYNGYRRVPHFAPFVAAVLAAAGVPTVIHGGAGIPPKRGCTHRAVLRELGGDVDAPVAAIAARLATVGWGYVDVCQHSPALAALRSLRDEIVKRPALSALEKLILPIRGRQETRLAVGYVHQGYDEALHAVVEDDPALVVRVVRGAEGHVDLKTWTETKGMDRSIGGTLGAVSLDPTDAGIAPLRFDPNLQVTPSVVAQLGADALAGVGGPAAEQIVWTAGCLLHWMAAAPDPGQGVEKARKTIADGRARECLRAGLGSASS
jgi:anthranilate phosphoribosyltransferase